MRNKMRAYIELSSHITALKSPSVKPSITQVEMGALNIGDKVALNGRYSITMPDGVSFEINSDSYVLPVDGNDISSRGFAELLAQYPMFEFIHFNPLLSDQDLVELDPTGTVLVNTTSYSARYQTGRSASGVDDGNAPVSTAMLSANNTVSPSKLGVIVTDNIDISPYVGSVSSGGGADQFMVYWRVYKFEDSHDIISRNAFGKNGQMNSPTVKNMVEIDQEISDLSVYISIDSGVTWNSVNRLQAISFCCKVDNIKLAFTNSGNDKIYLAHYSVMF